MDRLQTCSAWLAQHFRSPFCVRVGPPCPSVRLAHPAAPLLPWQAGNLPESMPALPTGLYVPLGMSSFVLGLLLSYRTAASYGRFVEARRIWAGIKSHSRDLARQVSS